MKNQIQASPFLGRLSPSIFSFRNKIISLTVATEVVLNHPVYTYWIDVYHIHILIHICFNSQVLGKHLALLRNIRRVYTPLYKRTLLCEFTYIFAARYDTIMQ